MITQSELKELFHYCELTGDFTRLKTNNHRLKVGQVAGYPKKGIGGKLYISIRINRKDYLAHRLAWLYIHGEFPSEEIDHLDGCGINNKLSNIRAVSLADNHKNRRKQSNNSSGLCGVWWDKRKSKWMAAIHHTHLGGFDNIFAAACARKSAERLHGYHKNHGSDRPL